MNLTDQQFIITQAAREDCEQIKPANSTEKGKPSCALLPPLRMSTRGVRVYPQHDPTRTRARTWTLSPRCDITQPELTLILEKKEHDCGAIWDVFAKQSK